MLRCPVCGSRRIYLDIGGYAGMRYRCKDCGYCGALIIEEDDDVPHEDYR
ncbi:MAG: hypothetical protein ACXQTG_05015 [Methanoculleaceae archaeon]